MRSIFTLVFLTVTLFSGVANAAMRTLCAGATATGVCAAGPLQFPVSPPPAYRSFQAYGTTSAGSGACAVKVQASNDGLKWLDLGTITLTLGTAVTNDGFSSNAIWPFVRGNVASISGTTGTCSLTVGY